MKKLIIISIVGTIIFLLGFFILAVDVQETKKKLNQVILKTELYKLL